MTRQNLKELVIITEHFAPMNTTAAIRPTAWAHHLHEFDYYPIVVTKSDEGMNSHEKHETFEIFRVACPDTFIARARSRHRRSAFGKLMGLIDGLLQNRLYYNSLSYLEQTALQIISERSPVGMLVTAPSFSLFGLGARIADQTNIKWIADYRDDWTTNQETSTLTKIIYRTERALEKQYLHNAQAFFSVSGYQKSKIEKLINLHGFIIANGYDEAQLPIHTPKPQNAADIEIDNHLLNIIYTGTLYKSQRLSFLNNTLKLIKNDLLLHLRVLFIGVHPDQIAELTKDFKQIVVVADRIAKPDVDQLLCQCDAALFIAYRDRTNNKLKGIPSSKIYEYIKYRMPVLMLPGDSDVAEETLKDVGLALSPATPREAAKLFEKLIANKLNGDKICVPVNDAAYKRHSRRASTKAMAKIFETVLG